MGMRPKLSDSAMWLLCMRALGLDHMVELSFG